jgi:CheY-like chemotaxis protein
VDDEAVLRRTYARALTKAGCTVTQTSCGDDALAAVREASFDVIVSDVSMPGMNGVELLRRVREHDTDVPVMLVTGSPSIETAAEAVDHGALRYLLKPLKLEVLVDHVKRATKLRRLAQVKREAIELLGGDEKLLGEQMSLEVRFANGLRDLWMAYQPIVGAENTRIIAYEALVRTREPSMPNPGALFEAAERLGRVAELGRRIRDSVAMTLGERNPQVDVFVNLHAADLSDESLYSADSPLSAFASQVVLEITERVALDHRSDVAQRIRRLRSLGYRIAIDDLGAGYAGLN